MTHRSKLLRRRFNWTQADDVAPWVSAALASEHWYGDGYPRWAGRETSEQAESRRKAIVKFCVRYGSKTDDQDLVDTAERLSDCHEHNRCMSGACPACTRAIQRFFVAEAIPYGATKSPSENPKEAVLASLVSEPISFTNLDGNLFEATKKRASRILKAAGVSVALGGVDVSLNVDRSNDCHMQWSIHLWFLTYGRHWEAATRAAYRSPAVSRPLMLKYHDGRRAALAYALKNSFVQRSSFIQTIEKSGTRRKTRNTYAERMCVDGRATLYPFLDDQGLARRVFLIGLKPTLTDGGVLFKPIAV